MNVRAGVGQYVAGETHLAAAGRAWRPGVRRAVVIHGGRGQTALQNNPPDAITRHVSACGAPVLYYDCVDGKQWGNDTSRTRTGQVWAFAQSSFGALSDKLVLYGSSMGALVVLNYALANPTKVAAIVGLIPAIDLRDLHDNNRGVSLGFDSSTDIETAYGGAAAYSAAATAHNPAENAAAFNQIPMLLCYSGNDPACLPSITAAFAANVGSSCTAVNMGNYGHAPPPTSDPQWLVVVGLIVRMLARYI